MKHAFLLSSLLLAAFCASYAQNNNDKIKGRFYFHEGDLRDLGDIKPNQVTTDTFWFENIGISPIIMKFVTASAPFISASWSREAVKQEQRGYVAYSVRAAKKPGPFSAQLFIQSNALIHAGEQAYVLHVKGNILKDNSKPAKKKKTVKKVAVK